MSRRDAVRRFEHPPGWLRAATDGDRLADAVRSRSVPGLAAGEHVLAGRPLGLRLTESRWALWCEATVAAPGQEPRDVTVTGSLRPEGTGSGVVQLADLRVVDGDSGLPALGLLTDPGSAADLLRRALGERRFPGIDIAGCEPRVARHARATRATVVLHLRYPPGADPAWPRAVVAKAYRSDEGAATYDAMSALWATDLSTGRQVAIAEPLAYLPEHRVLVQGFLPGVTMTERLVAALAAHSPTDRLRDPLRATADGLAPLHASTVPLGEERTPQWLVGRVRKAVRRLAAFVPSIADAGDRLVGPLERRAAELPADPPGPSHGGFRPAQVLVDDDAGPVAFLDFDGFCRAEPAFDLGRFTARLREIGLAAADGPTPPLSPGRRAEVDALAEVVVDHYAARRPVSRERVALWAELELVTALVQTWTRGQLARTAALAALLGGTAGT